MFWICVILKVNGAEIDMYCAYVKPTKNPPFSVREINVCVFVRIDWLKLQKEITVVLKPQ